MTHDQLRDSNPAVPMTWKNWILRTMILHPERICDPKELAAWKQNHAVGFALEQKQFRAGDKRNNYGVTGRSR